MDGFPVLNTNLRACLGEVRADFYQRELSQSAAHHQMMKGIVAELPADANILFIEMTQRGLAGHSGFSRLPKVQRDLYRQVHTGSVDRYGPFHTFRHMLGFEVGDKRFSVWNVAAGEEAPSLQIDHVDGVIFSGSEMMVTEVGACDISLQKMKRVSEFLDQARQYAFPLLGVCFSHQWIAHMFDGAVNWLPSVTGERVCEVGPSPLKFNSAASHDPLLAGLESLYVQAYHYQGVTSLPRGAIAMGSNHLGDYQVLRYAGLPWWTLQVHPELTGIFGDVARTLHGLPVDHLTTQETHELRNLLFPRFLGLVRTHRSTR